MKFGNGIEIEMDKLTLTFGSGVTLESYILSSFSPKNRNRELDLFALEIFGCCSMKHTPPDYRRLRMPFGFAL